jgi:hypothetical protein
MLILTAADGHRYDGSNKVRTYREFEPTVFSGCRKTADENRPVTPVDFSVDGLRVCLERDRLACRGLAPVLLGWLAV